MPRDPQERAIYEAQMERIANGRSRNRPRATRIPIIPAWQMNADQKAAQREARLQADAKTQELLDLPPDERIQADPEDAAGGAPHAGARPEAGRTRALMQEFTPEQRETVMAMRTRSR